MPEIRRGCCDGSDFNAVIVSLVDVIFNHVNRIGRVDVIMRLLPFLSQQAHSFKKLACPVTLHQRLLRYTGPRSRKANEAGISAAVTRSAISTTAP